MFKKLARNPLNTICFKDIDHNLFKVLISIAGSGGRAVERRTVHCGDGGSIPSAAVLKLKQFRSPHIRLCLSEETLKAGCDFYLVSMPGEVKYLTGGTCVTCSGLTISRDDNNGQQVDRWSINGRRRREDKNAGIAISIHF